MFVLNAVEARVAGSLIEKEITTPEYYPLSLNALLTACNQKSSRDPVMELSEPDVRSALSQLEQQGLVRVLADTRVPKFEHRLRDRLQLRRDEVAVLCLLLLRGPQTAAELRARADRLYSFDDTAAVQSTLERLAGREDPLVQSLGRQPGSREARWQHQLSGPTEHLLPHSSPAPTSRSIGATPDVTLAERVAALEARVQQLEAHLFQATPKAGHEES